MDPIERRAFLYGDDVEEVAVDEPSSLPENVEEAGHYAARAQVWDDVGERIAFLFDQEIKRLQAMKADQLKGPKAQSDWYKKALEGWHRAEYAAGRVRKTFKFPSGLTLKLRAAQPATEILDLDELTAWAETAGHLDAVFPRASAPAKRVLKGLLSMVDAAGEPGSSSRYVDGDGVEVPGIRARFLEDRWNA